MVGIACRIGASLTTRSASGKKVPTVTTLSGFSSPVSIVAADFNGDGVPDLAVGNHPFGPGSAVKILPNNGTGTFTALGSSPATTNGVPWMAAGDMNEDGKTDGDGTFGTPAVLDTGTHFPGAMAAADFNGDHHLDVAVVTGDSTAERRGVRPP